MRERAWTDGLVRWLIWACLAVPACGAQQFGWRAALMRFSGGGNEGGVTGQTLAGEWRGGKTQNDVVHGGF